MPISVLLRATQSHSLAPSTGQEVIVVRCLEVQQTLEIIFLSFPKREMYFSSKRELKYVLPFFFFVHLFNNNKSSYIEKHTESQSFLFLLYHHWIMANGRALGLAFVSYLLLQNQQREHKILFVCFLLVSRWWCDWLKNDNHRSQRLLEPIGHHHVIYFSSCLLRTVTDGISHVLQNHTAPWYCLFSSENLSNLFVMGFTLN